MTDFSNAPDVPNSPAPDLSAITGPAPQPAAPPNPILSAPLPNASAPDPQSQPATQSPSAASALSAPSAGTPSVWKQVVAGALAGLQSGGPNFASGVAGGAQAETHNIQQQRDNALIAQKQEADIRFSTLQAAHMVAETHKLTQEVDAWPQEQQNAFFDRNAKTAQTIEGLTGATPEYATSNDSDSEIAALKDATAKNGGVPPYISLQIGANSFLHYNADKLQQGSGALTLVNEQNQRTGLPPVTEQEFRKLPAAQQIALGATAAKAWTPTSNPQQLQMQKNDLALIQSRPDDFYRKQDSVDTLTKTIAQSQTLVDKAQADARNVKAAQVGANAAAKAANTPAKAEKPTNPDWVVGATADEKKKSELAENISENSAAVNSILARRPDLIGAVAGRFTSTAQMIGNNDPDISALGTRIHNISMASSGIHGFRSTEGVQKTENLLLNNFRNGPTAVAGALKATTDSVQTFIDNARPSTYRTHSSQGGASAYYQKQQGQQSAPQMPAGATHVGVSSLDGQKYYLNAQGQKLGKAQ